MLQQTRNKPPGAADPARMRMPEATILVVEDDPGMRTALLKVLRGNGFRCEGAVDGPQMLDALERNEIDLVLLDVMLPGVNGFDLCRHLRSTAQSTVPVIIISARGEEADRVVGLELGADDYIAKPFGESELLARVRAMLRRARMLPENSVRRARRLRFAGWTVDLDQRELFAQSGARIELSAAEYDLLVALLDHPQRVIGRDALLEMSRTRLGNASDRTIDVHICRLRRKLDDESKRELIRTIRGSGYLFARPVERL